MIHSTPITYAASATFTLRVPALQFDAGKVWGVLGPNGSGKSTLLRVLARQLTPTSGAVSVSSLSAPQPTARQWSRVVAFVSQDGTADPDLTVAQYVLLGRIPFRGLFHPFTAEDGQVVSDVLARCGVEEFAERQLASLSGGQRQRTRIARALAQEAPTLLLDEPTNHLDAAAIVEVAGLLRSLAADGFTVIVSLHDLDLATVVTDNVLILRDGELHSQGPTTTVVTAETVRDVWGVHTTTVFDGERTRLLVQYDTDR